MSGFDALDEDWEPPPQPEKKKKKKVLKNTKLKTGSSVGRGRQLRANREEKTPEELAAELTGRRAGGGKDTKKKKQKKKKRRGADVQAQEDARKQVAADDARQLRAEMQLNAAALGMGSRAGSGNAGRSAGDAAFECISCHDAPAHRKTGGTRDACSMQWVVVGSVLAVGAGVLATNPALYAEVTAFLGV